VIITIYLYDKDNNYCQLIIGLKTIIILLSIDYILTMIDKTMTVDRLLKTFQSFVYKPIVNLYVFLKIEYTDASLYSIFTKTYTEAFYTRCQRRILRVRRQDMVRNTAIAEKTGLQSVSAIIDVCRAALSGHVARLDKPVPCRVPFCSPSLTSLPRDLAAALATRGSNRSCTPTYPLRSTGMLLSDLVMVLRRNVPRWARDFDDDDG